jgi:DNA-binding transcriptional MocR family regulator
MWRWLYTELRSAIIDGRLKSGARLPSTRNLAAQYGLARGTVVAAFQQLQAEGFVSSEVSAGTFVVPAPAWEMTSPTKQRSSRQIISRATIAKRTQSLLKTTFFLPSVRRFGATSRLSTCFQSNCGRGLRRAFIAKHRVLCMGKVMQVVIRHCAGPSRNMWASPAEYVVLLNRSS